MSWDRRAGQPATAPPLEVGADDLAVLPYTSGTTGLPKGCMHLHSQPHAQRRRQASLGQRHGRERGAAGGADVPHHRHGQHDALQHLHAAPRWSSCRAGTATLAGRLISRWKVTSWTNIPTMVIDLMASPNFDHYDLSSLVHIGGGGAAMPQAVAQRLLEQFGLQLPGGLRPDRNRGALAHQPARGPQAAVPGHSVHEQRRARGRSRHAAGNAGRRTGRNHHPRPRWCSQGYWKRPDATAAAFIEFEGKRFFRSGDMGRMDEDGYFFMTDRLKRMINASGFKVWPAEVEALMFRHPAIQEACVIATKDSYRGETVKAVVVLRASHKGQVERAGHHRLVPREHGGLQGPAHRAVRRRAAQERQRQGDVADVAGSGKQGVDITLPSTARAPAQPEPCSSVGYCLHGNLGFARSMGPGEARTTNR